MPVIAIDGVRHRGPKNPPGMLEALAPAKINLGLHVLRVRPDGFRDIDTVFLRIPWCDRIEVHPAPGLSMTCSDPTLPIDERNLCMRAALALRAEVFGGSVGGRGAPGASGAPVASGSGPGAPGTSGPAPGPPGPAPGARIHLEKRVPYGAGLGSGSSDAATTLRLLTRLWGLAIDEDRLAAVAASLGSDVPFFLGPAVARGTGRGEILTACRIPGADAFEFVVAVPPVHVATGPAYAMVEPSDDDRPDLAELIASGDPESWRGRLVNDFEEPVASAYPEIAQALEALADAGARYVSLSGSGSAVFGMFTDLTTAEAATERLRADGCTVWVGKAGDPG